MSIEFSTFSRPSFVRFTPETSSGSGPRLWVARAQNFIVEWIEATSDNQQVSVASEHEMILLPLGAGIGLTRETEEVQTPARSVCVSPGGKLSIMLSAGGRCAVLSSSRSDLADGAAVNASRHEAIDPRIVSMPATLGAPSRRAEDRRVPGRPDLGSRGQSSPQDVSVLDDEHQLGRVRGPTQPAPAQPSQPRQF